MAKKQNSIHRIQNYIIDVATVTFIKFENGKAYIRFINSETPEIINISEQDFLNLHTKLKNYTQSEIDEMNTVFMGDTDE